MGAEGKEEKFGINSNTMREQEAGSVFPVQLKTAGQELGHQARRKAREEGRLAHDAK